MTVRLNEFARRDSGRLLGIAGIACASLLLSAPGANGQTRTWTLDADFDQGVLVNVNHDTPNNDQLQLNTLTTPFPFVWVACSARGTAVRIDVNTGAILGEYLTAPNGMGRDPSRTTVDLNGNVWLSNRAEASVSGGQPKGSVTRIGLIIGGTRCDADGTANPAGQYLKPPFLYNTCIDRDGDGLIKTSQGLGNILAWNNTGGVDSNGGVTTADDEAIINYTRVIGTNTRTVAVDANNDLWTGGLGNLSHEKLSGITGLPIPGTQFNVGCGGYGGLVDGNNVLWSAQGGRNLLRYDATTGANVCLDLSHGNYGLGIDPQTGHVWHTNLAGNSVVELDSAGNVLAAYGHGSFYAQGVAVDSIGNVWIAHSLVDSSTTVGHLRTNGVFVGNVGLPGGVGPTGVAVDSNGKVWVANIYSNNAMRIDPMAGPIGGGGFPIGAVDMTVNLGAGAGPYNYSDMTGFVSLGSTAPQGTWTVIYDTGRTGTDRAKVSWTSNEPVGTSVTVEVRAADNVIDLPAQAFVAVSNGTEISGMAGQYYEIRSTLATTGTTLTPVLYDLTILCNRPPDCSNAYPSVAKLWPPEHQFVPVSIMGVTDPDGDQVTITITSIFQDEMVYGNGQGAGNSLPDARGVGTDTALLRAERNGGAKTPGDGRVYHVRFTADDGRGGTCTGEVRVCVPHDNKKDSPCIDGGALYDSTVAVRPMLDVRLDMSR